MCQSSLENTIWKSFGKCSEWPEKYSMTAAHLQFYPFTVIAELWVAFLKTDRWLCPYTHHFASVTAYTLNLAHTFILKRHGSARGQSSCWIKLGERWRVFWRSQNEKKEYCAQSKLFLTTRKKPSHNY